MLLIRRAQLEALGRAHEESFERRAAGHLRVKYPDPCRELGEAAVRQSVRTAMAKRKEHRFETEECVLLYLDLMYLLGFDCDSDPDLPWVREMLADEALGARTRLVLLEERARKQPAKRS
jgi:hypothetical protein